MAEDWRKGGGTCRCYRAVMYKRHKRKKEQCKRKRQTYVYNPDEELWHEPYMRDLRKEFSDVSILCDSKIELPWRDIVLPTAGMKIRPEAPMPLEEGREVVDEGAADKTDARESTGAMVLPWQDLIITETVQSRRKELEACDSSLEIPWSDLALERPMEIRAPPEKEPCVTDDVEIPWDDILIPQNIVIESQRRRKHPSSKHPPRPLTEKTCNVCHPCCVSAATRMRPTTSCT
ncbi:hypothetical protein KM043_002388 [Ampulex compressa]|nr:hypothetical protein KM043_002388 [Ampulex compressa]